jgi:hypothetical protein
MSTGAEHLTWADSGPLLLPVSWVGADPLAVTDVSSLANACGLALTRRTVAGKIERPGDDREAARQRDVASVPSSS